MTRLPLIRLSGLALVSLGLLAASSPVSAAPLAACPALIVETFGSRASAACSVAWCESKYDPDAVSPDGRNIGFFQINLVHGQHASTDPWTNVAYAFRLSAGGTDWSAWSCRP